MITSTSNAKIKNVCQLIKSASHRREEGVFVIEGLRICSEAPRGKIREAYISESCLNKCNAEGNGPGTSDFVFRDTEYEIVSDAVFKKMSDTVSSQGALCVVKAMTQSAYDFAADKKGDLKLLLLEGIQDPGNLGTMIRTSEAAGFDAIVTDGRTVDVYNPKVIRSTMGGIFRVPVMVADDFKDFLQSLKETGVTLYAALLEGSQDFHEITYNNRAGILIGNEGNGLSKEIAELSDVHVKIPMAGEVESLNAAVAAALMMYETTR